MWLIYMINTCINLGMYSMMFYWQIFLNNVNIQIGICMGILFRYISRFPLNSWNMCEAIYATWDSFSCNWDLHSNIMNLNIASGSNSSSPKYIWLLYDFRCLFWLADIPNNILWYHIHISKHYINIVYILCLRWLGCFTFVC